MVVSLVSALDQDAVVAQSETEVAGVSEGLQPAPLESEVVVGDQQRALEVLLVEIDVPFDGGDRIRQLGAGDGVALAPHAERADVNEGHVRVAVIARCGGGQEVIELFEEDGVVEIGLEHRAIRGDAAAGEMVSLGAGLLDPARCGVGFRRPAFRGGEPEGHGLAFRDPFLHGGVDDGPVELAFLGLEIGPGQPDVDGTDAGELIHPVGWGQVDGVGGDVVVVMLEHPAHARVDEGRAGVLGLDHGSRGLGRSGLRPGGEDEQKAEDRRLGFHRSLLVSVPTGWLPARSKTLFSLIRWAVVGPVVTHRGRGRTDFAHSLEVVENKATEWGKWPFCDAL